MQSYFNMTSAFEKEKNVKALTYTASVCVALFIIFFFVQWQLPAIPPPPVEPDIEVNLGNSDEGLGDVPPMIPGEQSSEAENNFTPPPTSQAVPEKQNIAGDENESDEAPVVNNTVTKPVNKPVQNQPVINNRPKPNSTPVTNPTPVPPSPKAVYKGGTKAGPGGNNADSYNGVNNQGIAGGKGDQGNPNGNPNSDSYKGNAPGGNTGGVRIKSGLSGRRFTRLPSFEDEFNENAKVAVDITVDQTGNVIAAVVNPRGTTTPNANIRSIALRKARQLKLNSGSEDEQTGTIVFDFKLRG